MPSRWNLQDFWAMPPGRREAILLREIATAHAWHYAHNRAYRQIVAGRGVEPAVPWLEDVACSPLTLLPRLLRPTAQTFKSYIDILGTPFPQERPQAFLEWLDDQLSIELPRERFVCFGSRYRSLEALLRAVECNFSGLGLEMSTSSGTSGRATIMVRDRAGTERTVESFYLCFVRYLGMAQVERAIFVMPTETRIAMARMASFSVKRLGLPHDRVHFAIPFPADPDRVRVRAGRTFRPGVAGLVEQRLSHPLMGWMQERCVDPRAVRNAIDLLEGAATRGERVLLFGGWVHLHAIALELERTGRTLRLARGSLVGTGGGLKERYPLSPSQIRAALAEVLVLADGGPIPIRDVYGMAEGNWAAMQCHEGNYHVPPWVYARTLDQDDEIQAGPDTTGLLAFFDPHGAGRLFPAFFKTADRVRLVRAEGRDGEPGPCPCGEAGTYIAHGSIQRVDLLDEAGCAAQI